MDDETTRRCFASVGRRWGNHVDASNKRAQIIRCWRGETVLIPLKLVRDQQLQQQLFDQLRDLIVSGRLRPGSRMPSSRMMAEQFAISRMTVLLTYERLVAEGHLETRPAAGTFVARAQCPVSSRPSDGASALSLAHPPPNPRTISSPDVTAPLEHDRPAVLAPDARVGAPDPSLFPVQRWRSLMRQALDRFGAHLGADHPAGNPALREAIASWLSTSRGLAVSAGQVMLVRGRQQALHVVAHLASHPCEGRRATRQHPGQLAGCPMAAASGHGTQDDPMASHATDRPCIVVEDPCDADAAAALAGGGAVLRRIPVDAAGLRTDLLPNEDAILIHVTPEHQRPLGAILARDRRATLLDWASRSGALVLEEDIDGELRYGDMAIPSLMSLDRSERVILLGGFGVSLGPWLDMAYLVLPRWLVPFAAAARRLIDDSHCTLEQAALAEFFNGGGYPRHLHRLNRAYASRRDALISALERHFGGPVRILGEHAGLRLAWFPPPDFGSPGELASAARRHGLDAAALGDDAVLLGFGVTDEHHIKTGVRHLAEALAGGGDDLRLVAAMVRDRPRPIVLGRMT